MPTLRDRARPGQPDRRRPRRQRRADRRSRSREAADAGAHLVVVPRDGADRLPGRGPGVPGVVRRGVPRGASSGWPRELADDGLGELPVVVGYLDRRRTRRRRRRPPESAPADARRGAARRRRSSPATPSTTCPTTASSTRSATSCPATRCIVVRIRGVDVALAICEDLWQDGGPFAAAARGRGRPAGRHQRLAVRAQQGRRPAASWSGAGPPRRGCAARLRQHGRRPGRAGLRRRLDGRRRRRRAARPRAAVRRASCWSSTSTCPAATARDADRRRPASSGLGIARTVVSRATPVAAVRAARRRAGRAAARRRGRDLARAGRSGLRDYVRKNGFRSVVLGLSGGIDSALVAAIAVRRARRRERVSASRCPSELLVASTPGRRRRPGRAHRPATTDAVPIAADGRRVPDGASTLTGLAEENLQARVRGVI